MKDNMEALTLECLETMKGALLPGIAEQLKARDKALEIHNEKSGKIRELDTEIGTLTARIGKLRESAARSGGSKDSIEKIVTLKNKISALQEIREEIEANILPEAAKQLETANQAVFDAVLPLLDELCGKETERIRALLKGTVHRVNAYNDAIVGLQEFLNLRSERALSLRGLSGVHIENIEHLNL